MSAVFMAVASHDDDSSASDLDDDVVKFVDGEEIAEGVNNISANQTVVAALLLAFTYAVSAESISLDGICEQETGTCTNVLGTSERSTVGLIVYQCVCFLTTLTLLMIILYHTTLITQFARLPKAQSKTLRERIGHQLGPYGIVNDALVLSGQLFIMLMYIQASLVFDHMVFWPMLAVGVFVNGFLWYAVVTVSHVCDGVVADFTAKQRLS